MYDPTVICSIVQCKTLIYHGIRKQKEGGGVSVLVNSLYESSLILNESYGVTNAVIVALPQLKFKVCGFYRPIDQDDVNDFDNFIVTLDSILSTDYRLLLLGDLNVNLLANDTESSQYVSVVSSNGFSVLNKK